MPTLTVYLKNQSKQVVNQSHAVLTDKNGKRLKNEEIQNRVKTIAQSIGGRSYANHKFSFS